MRTITLSVPDEIYRQARIHAAEQGTSVSALVAAHLRSLSGLDTELARLAALQRRTFESVKEFSAGDRLDRDAVHERALS